jgi:hypothetical protein
MFGALKSASIRKRCLCLYVESEIWAQLRLLKTPLDRTHEGCSTVSACIYMRPYPNDGIGADPHWSALAGERLFSRVAVEQDTPVQEFTIAA